MSEVLSVAAGNYEGGKRVKVFGIFDTATCSCARYG